MYPALRYWLLQLPGLLLVVMLLGFALREDWITPGMAGLALALWVIKDAVLYIPWSHALHKHTVPLGRQALIGRSGTTISRIGHQGGQVRVDGEIWQATTTGRSIPAGTRIRVCTARGMALEVENAE